MKRAVFAAGMAATALALAASVHAQKTTEVHPGKAGSPHIRTEYTIDGATLTAVRRAYDPDARCFRDVETFVLKLPLDVY